MSLSSNKSLADAGLGQAFYGSGDEEACGVGGG